MIATNKDGYELLECITLKEDELKSYEPLAGSYAVVNFNDKYLLCFNTLRKHWEVPAGGRADGETPKECAIRELFEETTQVVRDMDFKGLLKVKKPNGVIKYNPVYFAELDYIAQFKENNETDKILFWNLSDDIGYVDEVDMAAIKWCMSFNIIYD
ncbi:NUDIX hydrolase [Paenibacillus glycanilyticus]|uniref:NUDIX domain-containing protein n=1 Tax=Paenibacillus glycanilyticus TaxID=126569 RepID=UPI002040129B|nr:NUDIX hydrolase [Paenibacillus glycanilyticus]MCM3626778.1 NUDIX hydrolase [Paenibacillus glycanilyticus]